jgi:hypothetical protein
VGKTVTKYRNKDRDYENDDYGSKGRKQNYDKRSRKVSYEEILEQFEEETDFILDEDGLAT